MFELRILNGLHRGATLPLDERSLLIGADDDADVVLVDPGIETRHATLAPSGRGWTLSAKGGEVLGTQHNQPLATLELQAGQFARLGHVWLCVARIDAAWENPPHAPADSEPEPEKASEPDPGEDELYEDSPEDAAPEAPPPPPPPPPPKPPAPKAVRRSGWRRSKTVLVPLALVTILSACAAYKMRSDDKPKVPAAAAAPAARPAPKISQAELREAFRARLKEVDLLKRFKLDLRDGNWTMQAFLDDEEAARFDRILKAFMRAHDITFPVHAKVGSAEAMLPFRIREVITGSHASLVTQDGKRLYVGDEHRGLRLVAIDGHHLQFDGERRIKVSW